MVIKVGSDCKIKIGKVTRKFDSVIRIVIKLDSKTINLLKVIPPVIRPVNEFLRIIISVCNGKCQLGGILRKEV